MPHPRRRALETITCQRRKCTSPTPALHRCVSSLPRPLLPSSEPRAASPDPVSLILLIYMIQKWCPLLYDSKRFSVKMCETLKVPFVASFPWLQHKRHWRTLTGNGPRGPPKRPSYSTTKSLEPRGKSLSPFCPRLVWWTEGRDKRKCQPLRSI